MSICYSKLTMMDRTVLIYCIFLLLQASVDGKGVRSFPEKFEFGVSTAAYQIEGSFDEDGKSPSIWDVATHSNLVKNGENADVAADSYHKFNQDIMALKELGVHFYHFSLSWSRILPDGFSNNVNQAGIAYYRKLIDELLDKKIKPMITLYHHDLPSNLQKFGGWVNPNIVKWFTDYAKVVFDHFGANVRKWITFHDPAKVCEDGYSLDKMAPMINVSGIAGYLCTKNLLLAHANVYHLYDELYRKTQLGKVGITIGCTWYQPASSTVDDVQAAVDARQFEWGLYAHPIFSKAGDFPNEVKKNVGLKSAEQGYPRSRLPFLSAAEVVALKGSADFLGISSFTTKLTYRDASLEGMYRIPSLQDDESAVFIKDPTWVQSLAPWLQSVPWGFYKVLLDIKYEYDNPPVFITANGWATSGNLVDEDRIVYIRAYLNALLDAIDQDCDIRGYSLWSLIDGFEWMSGYSEKYGLYHVDYDNGTLSRTPRKSAFTYRDMIVSKTLDPDHETDSKQVV